MNFIDKNYIRKNEAAKDLIKKLLELYAYERITIEEALSHSFLRMKRVAIQTIIKKKNISNIVCRYQIQQIF